MIESNHSSHVIDELREKLRTLEQSFRSVAVCRDKDVVPTAIDALNRVLPKRGIRGGSVVEWLADGEGAGAVLLAFKAVTPFLSAGETCVVVDERREFHPAPIAALGVDLSQLLIAYPCKEDVLWAVEQSLRCRGVAVTAAWLGPQSDRVLRRLQLAAEAGGGIGMFFRPAKVQRQPAWADIRLLVGPRGTGGSPVVRIEVLYCPGAEQGKSVEVEISDESPDDVRVVPPLGFAERRQHAT